MVDIEIMLSIVAGLISALAAFIAFSISVLSYHHEKKRAAKREVPPGERIQKSISKLSNASKEIDVIIQDIVNDIKKRQTVLEQLKASNQTLRQEEEETSKRLKILKDTPLEVANYFQQISEQTLQQVEKRRARRDIVMFIFGILATTVIAILLRAFGLG
jgi:Ca2+/Na+ antiporter